MVTVRLTRHLYSFFPALDGQPLQVRAGTVAEVVRELDALAPGLRFYVCDELGRLRSHVNIFIGDERIRDRRGLTDPVPDASCVSIFQALSGG